MVNPYGYANMEDSWLEHWLNSTVTVPCSSHALALNWRHDNDGPAGVEEVLDIYAHLRKEFPGAKIIASTLVLQPDIIRFFSTQSPCLTMTMLDDARMPLRMKC